MTDTDFIAVASGTDGIAGVIAWWSAYGPKLRASVVAEAERHGVKPPNAETAAQVAMRRALEAECDSSHLVRARKGTSGKVLELVVIVAGENKNDYRLRLSATLDDAHALVCTAANPEVASLDAMRFRIGQRFEQELRFMTGADVGAWIRDTLYALDGVLMRTEGGNWFVPVKHRAKVDALRSACEAFGAHVTRIPVMRSDKDALADILRGLEQEALAACAAMEADLDRNSEQGKRARLTKESTIADLKAKISAYTAQFGGQMSKALDALDGLRAKVNNTMVVSDALAAGRSLPGNGERSLLDLSDSAMRVTADTSLPAGPARPLELDGIPDPIVAPEPPARPVAPVSVPRPVRAAEVIAPPQDSTEARFNLIEEWE